MRNELLKQVVLEHLEQLFLDSANLATYLTFNMISGILKLNGMAALLPHNEHIQTVPTLKGKENPRAFLGLLLQWRKTPASKVANSP